VIVRILGEGQFDLSDDAVSALNDLDAKVETAIASGDDAAFHTALASLLDGVRTTGVPHEAESLDASDLILPMADASLAEVKDMLSGDGLIPG
jgi:soluble P-type ATPase